MYHRVLRPGESHSKTTRQTGKNIGKLMAEVDAAEAKGEFTWGLATGALGWIRTWIEHLAEHTSNRYPDCGELCTPADCETTWQQWHCYRCRCWTNRVAKFAETLNR